MVLLLSSFHDLVTPREVFASYGAKVLREKDGSGRLGDGDGIAGIEIVHIPAQAQQHVVSIHAQRRNFRVAVADQAPRDRCREVDVHLLRRVPVGGDEELEHPAVIVFEPTRRKRMFDEPEGLAESELSLDLLDAGLVLIVGEGVLAVPEDGREGEDHLSFRRIVLQDVRESPARTDILFGELREGGDADLDLVRFHFLSFFLCDFMAFRPFSMDLTLLGHYTTYILGLSMGWKIKVNRPKFK
ncbi:MAG: hypothetical protein LiPW15_275 [Parcubacteria group bacterium LiPW_15]|nr:MAG: hypothetical protein LiPW15_275 [Parcubacteria group bacterium LiPW_15]